MLPPVSVVIPALNEADNIAMLISRIEKALVGKCYFEIIFIDDHSEDLTIENIKKAAIHSPAPILVYSKLGSRGKAFSLIEGFQRASFATICMLDADLQYPPEAIPSMLSAIGMNSDVVVANRVTMDTSIARRGLSQFGRNIYGKWLHNIDCDVQSGLKVFRRDILTRISLSPKPWTFDLEFLVQARQAGYRITTIDIPFAKRVAGESKINVFGSGVEILTEAVKMKLKSQNNSLPALLEAVPSDDYEESQVVV